MTIRAILCAAICAAGIVLATDGQIAWAADGPARRDAGAITDFSAAQRTVTRSTTTRTNVVHTPHVSATRTTTTVRGSRTVTQQRFHAVGGVGTGGNPKFHKKPGQTPINAAIHAPISAVHLKPGPGKINPALKPIKFPVVKLGNKVAPVWKTQKLVWWGGKWKKFVPFTAIGVVLIGGAYFYPDAYVGFARPYCEGITPDGCRLNWQMVNFEDGGADWQCVQFCPRPGALPPPQAAALVAPPPVPAGSCEVTIYPEQNFAGTGVSTGEEQPQLSRSGWQNQIASIQVKTGTWDFFTDEHFTGETMRLAPGPYPALAPEWTKRIGSFMCVQPGA